MTFCAGNDENEWLDGVQLTVQVDARGFHEGALVFLSIDGAEPERQLGKPVVGESVTFPDFTLPAGIHSLEAVSEDLSTRSAPFDFEVDISPPEMTFVTPADGDMLGPANDLDPATPSTIETRIDVFVDVEDQALVDLTLFDPDDVAAAQMPVPAANRHAIFDVSLNRPGTWRIRVDAESSCGNAGSREISIEVVTSAVQTECSFVIVPAPLDLGPGPDALNASMDADPSTPLLQAQIVASTDSAVTAELYVDLVSAGTSTFDASGEAAFAISLEEGMRNLRVRCVKAGVESFSTATTVLVDVTPPSCAVSAPPDGVTLIPADDEDAGDSDLDFTVSVEVGGGDVDDNDAFITVGLLMHPTSVSNGTASIVASVSSPGDYMITGSAVDDAGNGCFDSIDVSVDLEGCGITWTSPTNVVTTDSNPDLAGVQIDVSAEITDDCAGSTVTLTGCDTGGPISGDAIGTPPTVQLGDITFCDVSTCDETRICTVSVTDASGITTSQDVTVHVDTAPPSVTLEVTDPDVPCGSTITPSDDIDAITDGTQVRVRMMSSPAASRSIEVTGAEGPPSTSYTPDELGFAVITATAGTNSIVALATDENGLTGSASCALTLADLAITIATPNDGANLGPNDGIVQGTNLLVDVCGTISDPTGASVALFVDMTEAGATTPDAGGSWCLDDVSVPSGTHTIRADAFASGTGNSGTTSITVTVDLTAPPGPTGFTGSASARNAADLSFTAPSDDGEPADRCVIKASRDAITDDTFEAQETVYDQPGAPPETIVSASAMPLQLGAWHFAMKCYDAAGNGSALVTTVPITLAFAQDAPIGPTEVPGVVSGTYNLADAYFGYSMTSPDIDDDGFADLFVGAPNATLAADGGFLGEGLVYVYLGGPSGIASTPDFVIRGVDGEGYLGISMTTVDWNGDGIDDVAIGQPGAFVYQGAVRIFYGEAVAWTAGASTTFLEDTDADVVITASAAGEWSFAVLGWSVAAAEFDGTAPEDLVIGMPGASGFVGAAIVLFGGSSAPSITLPGDLGTTSAYRFDFSSGITGAPEYGNAVANLGTLGHGPGVDTLEDIVIAPRGDAVRNPDALLSEDRVFIYYGRPAPAAGTIVTIANDAAQEQVIAEDEADGITRFAEGGIGSIGDQNGDGRRELVVTAMEAGGSRVGSAWVIPIGGGTVGGTQVITDLRVTSPYVEINSTDTNKWFGSSSANPVRGGDIDGDGEDDLLVSTRYSAALPSLFAWHGGSIPTGTVLWTTAAAEIGGPAGFESSTTAVWAGDLDGDGLLDVVWADAMYLNSAMTNQTGAIQVMY